MKIYFSGAKQAGDKFNSALVDSISNESVYRSKLTLPGISNVDLRKRMISQIEMADAFISVIDVPSLNDGYELCLAEQLDLPNLVLVTANLKLGCLILGSNKLNLVTFRNVSQARAKIKRYVKSFR